MSENMKEDFVGDIVNRKPLQPEYISVSIAEYEALKKLGGIMEADPKTEVVVTEEPKKKEKVIGPILELQLKQIDPKYHAQVLKMSPKQRKLIFKKLGLKFNQIMKV